MCNCGSKRDELVQQLSDNAHSPANKLNVRFEYIGKTALTVTGNITGNRYRFSRPGEYLQVDIRDVAGVMRLPVLRRVVEG